MAISEVDKKAWTKADEKNSKCRVCGTMEIEVEYKDQKYSVCPRVLSKKTLTTEDFEHYKKILKEVY